MNRAVRTPKSVTPPQRPDAPPSARVALYMRVSTGRQAESDLSIPDQRHQGLAYCASRGWQVVAEFVDAGLSGTDDKRPQFQRLMELASESGAPFDIVLVHSLSRFARDHFTIEMSIRRLAKRGIQLISMTQELGDDPTQVMMRQIITLFDEYQSRENAKHVLRAMKENARQGFWNGSRVPFGYQTVVAGQRGAKTKKKLAIDPVEAETVRLIFRLFLEGDGRSGPMGVKALVSWLNAHGYRTRLGARWGVGPTHKLLTNPVYRGESRFNRAQWRTGQEKPEAEQVVVAVEPIIDAKTFEAVQASLKSRNPRVSPPRVVSGPILLTGLATCAHCGGGMVLRTGKSGRYRYYACGPAAQKGPTACKGRAVPMAKLDDIVTERLADELLTPERIGALLTGLMERQTSREADYGKRLDSLRAKLTEAETRLGRLYQAIETGIADPADATLRDRIAGLKTERDIARVTLERAMAEMSPAARITEEKIAAFVEVMRSNVRNGDVPFRRAYIRSVIDQVEVDGTEIRIHGRRNVLERLVMGGGATPAGVPSFVRKWRALGESNPSLHRERVAS